MLMRYFFVLIGALIVFRAFRWLQRDARAYHREMRALPDAGLVGEIVNLRTGQAQPLPREGTIGASRECDVRVKDSGILRTHARFEFEEGKGLKIIPMHAGKVVLGGLELSAPGYALHGTQLQLGDALMRVRLFAGLKVPTPAAFQPDEAPDALPDEEDAPWSQAEPGFPAPFSPPEEQPFPGQGAPVSEGESFMPYPPGAAPAAPAAPYADYDGGFTEDGQMTWQYAYSLEDLRKAQEAKAQFSPAGPLPAEDEALPYESPVPRRRRRSRR